MRNLQKNQTKQYLLPKLADTKKLAALLAKKLNSHSVLALSGPIGAGKTTLVKSLAKNLGITKTVKSPTFTLLQPYHLPRARRGIKTLVHVDCYRVDDPKELLHIGLIDFLNDPTILVVIEWAEKIKWFLENRTKKRGTPRELWWAEFSFNPAGERVCDLRMPK